MNDGINTRASLYSSSGAIFGSPAESLGESIDTVLGFAYVSRIEVHAPLTLPWKEGKMEKGDCVASRCSWEI